MKLIRKELIPGINLNYIQSEKFKTSFMSISLLTQLTRETASMNGLIAKVLARGTAIYPDIERLNARKEELYGAVISPRVGKIGEIQIIGFFASFPEESFLPVGSDEFRQVSMLLCDMLLHPSTAGGLLQQKYVESEKEKLIQQLSSVINDKRSYAFQRCIEEMCCFEDYSVGRYGKEEDVEDINYKKLTKQYRRLLETSPVELFYCGKENIRKVTSVLRDCLSTLPRGEIDYDIGTDIRYNSIEEQPRFCSEESDIAQARLVMGFRLGDCMDLENTAPITVFNCIFGGGPVSKLFTQVRESMGLCYDINSHIDLRKGLMFVSAGISPDKLDVTRDEIFRQLELIKNGDITQSELDAARAVCRGDALSVSDSQNMLEHFYLVRILEGTEYSPEERAELIDEVTADDVVNVASGIQCDMIYFLSPDEADNACSDDTDYSNSNIIFEESSYGDTDL